ncbi:MOSC domain-containing protein [Flammeovirga pacifica]|uniref:MOSC domain-containing protein n=1 Tax=Flammeovirga pacifica TaxID=915059 RepID=A0A1S1YVL8_FLAPC|nr:MOSC N-terminal beta barrel domain-containing protein [Flammeovirga pacifica]OHX65078.1 hypothetical protein NH26_01290 [Flammeovirga pacifica]
MKLEKINIYPIKSLDPITVNEVQITEGKTLVNDRRWGIFRTSDGRTVNGKKYPKVHQLRAKFDLDQLSVELRDQAKTDFFSLEDRKLLEEYLSDYFEENVEVRENDATGFPDHTSGNVGASLISTNTIDWVAKLYHLSSDEVVRRMRMNLIIEADEVFEEDQWIGVDKSNPHQIKIGDVVLNAYKPCERCPVPTRDSFTSEVNKGFQKTFVKERLALQKDLLDHPLYAHAYMCGIVLNVPQISMGKVLKKNDAIIRL